jgi:hypothetical protein
MMRRELAVLLVLSFWAAACGQEEKASEAPPAPMGESDYQAVVGEWVAEAGETVLVLAEDDTFVLDTKQGQHLTGTFVFDSGVLSMTGGGEDAMARAFTGTLKHGVLRIRMRPRPLAFERR